MILLPRQESAISHHLKHHPEHRLSVRFDRQHVYFIEKATGNSVIVLMEQLLETYDNDRKAAARERVRAKRHEAKR